LFALPIVKTADVFDAVFTSVILLNFSIHVKYAGMHSAPAHKLVQLHRDSPDGTRDQVVVATD